MHTAHGVVRGSEATDSVWRTLRTAIEARSVGVMVRPSSFQITDTTGMSISGTMSVGVVTTAAPSLPESARAFVRQRPPRWRTIAVTHRAGPSRPRVIASCDAWGEEQGRSM